MSWEGKIKSKEKGRKEENLFNCLEKLPNHPSIIPKSIDNYCINGIYEKNQFNSLQAPKQQPKELK